VFFVYLSIGGLIFLLAMHALLYKKDINLHLPYLLQIPLKFVAYLFVLVSVLFLAKILIEFFFTCSLFVFIITFVLANYLA